jgi:hypothetical protein
MLLHTIHDGVLWQLAFQPMQCTMQFVDTFETRGDSVILIRDFCRRKKESDGDELPKYRHLAEQSALTKAGDPEPLHFGLESSAFHAKFARGTRSAAHHPVGVTENFQNVFPFGLFQCRC